MNKINLRRKRASERVCVCVYVGIRVGERVEIQAKRLLNCSISLNEFLKFSYHTIHRRS